MAKRKTTRPSAGSARRSRPATRRTGARKGASRSAQGPAKRSASSSTRAGSRKKPATTSRGASRKAQSTGARSVKRPKTGRPRSDAGSKRTTSGTRTLRRRTTAGASGPHPSARRPRGNRETGSLDGFPTPPSSLDFDRDASAARTGRAEMEEALAEHTETSPRLTAGDVDADWESAYSTGDEAPGGDMPTPDQDVVEEIGAALGVEYADNEELKSAEKIEKRDRNRWELDPASSEDYQDRSGRKR